MFEVDQGIKWTGIMSLDRRAWDKALVEIEKNDALDVTGFQMVFNILYRL
jgi:hypothetical protein